MNIICGDVLEELEKMEKNSVDLVIADPPYFKVVNQKWDYAWKNEDAYIDWCMEWIREVHRVLRYGGTFYLYGFYRTLSLLVPHLNYTKFALRQQIIIHKGMRSVAGKATKAYKMFPNVTESILFLIKDNIPYSRSLLRRKQKKAGLTAKKINEKLGVKSNGGGMWSIYTGNNICSQIPTEAHWNKLQKILDFDMPYEKIAQTFNPIMGLTDVWTDIDFYKDHRFHPTQKPLDLSRRLLLASSNYGDKVIDLFSGSGSVYIAAKELDRDCVSIEKDEKYIEIIKDRAKSVQKKLFKKKQV